MNKKLILLLALAGAGFFWPAHLRVQAQTIPIKNRESHIPIPGGSGSSADPGALLDSILNEAKEDSFVKKLVEEVAKNPKKYQTDLDALRKLYPGNLDANDPRLQETIREFVRDNPDLTKGNENNIQEKLRELQSNPAKIEDLQKRITSIVAPPSESSPIGGPGNPGAMPNWPKTGIPNQTNPDDPKQSEPAPKTNPTPNRPPDGSAESNASSNTFTERAFDSAKSAVDKMEKMVGDSVDLPALFARMKLTSDSGNDTWFEKRMGMTGDAFDNLGKRLNPERWISKLDGVLPAGMRLPSVSMGNLQGTFSQAGQASSQAVQSDKGWSLLLIVAFGAIVLTLFWKGLAWRNERAARDAVFRLGPWPVQPGLVHTPAELIKAFEYLSLLFLGKSARTLNHVEIAKNLGQTKTIAGFEQVQAAEALAALYEQARYAPWGASLPESDLSMARRHLTLLAGAHSA